MSTSDNGIDEPREEKSIFEPKENPDLPAKIHLPDELWQAILSCPCTFSSAIFNTVMLNLVKNPNLTSSHLFRADILYDSSTDHAFEFDEARISTYGLAKQEHRPIHAQWPGFMLDRTLVRQFVPRNPQLDGSLVQTCHFFHGESGEQGGEAHLVLYIPHVATAAEIPFYHPAVSRLAFLYTTNPSPTSRPSPSPSVFLLTLPFPTSPEPPTPKLTRTALRLLATIHKHGAGQSRGYEKRIHHDVLLPQARYQNTYTRLKTSYGRELSGNWVEVTDPGKHVFEDLGIAAFLIELWGDMYCLPAGVGGGEVAAAGGGEGKVAFPGFVDLGAGNGLLVSILLREGYPGWGVDARTRKTWTTFPSSTQEKLHQQILTPDILQKAAAAGASSWSSSTSPVEERKAEAWFDGILPPGTFIISNHADELTLWTPLLAYLNSSPFAAIPCCSHDFSGARFRAPSATRAAKAGARLPQQMVPPSASREGGEGSLAVEREGMVEKQAAETGSLKKTAAQKKMPSAYASLCTYVSSLAEELGYEPETEVLRIPSTRNTCIVGRHRKKGTGEDAEGREKVVTELVEREMKMPIADVAGRWIARAAGLAEKPGSGH